VALVDGRAGEGILLILPDAGRTPAGAEVGRGDAAEGGGFSWWRRRLSGFRVRGTGGRRGVLMLK